MNISEIIQEEIEKFIEENPDNIYKTNHPKLNHNLRWNNSDALAFGYNSIYDDMMTISDLGDTHSDIGGRGNMKYPGRIWLNAKIMSFWEYPETKDILNKVIKDLNSAYKEKYGRPIIDQTWKIEVETGGYEWDNIIIPINDYKSSENPDMGKEHVKSPLLKTKKNIPYMKRKPLPWRQALGMDEDKS